MILLSGAPTAVCRPDRDCAKPALVKGLIRIIFGEPTPLKLHLRDEDRTTERRTPIVPGHAGQLVAEGWSVDVESSGKRIFEDRDYERRGCRIVPPRSWIDAEADTVVLGLKELAAEPASLPHRMIHFAHIYKNQHGWEREIGRFARGGGILYDLEFLTDSTGRRLVAFGYWAGWVGAALALWRHLAREQGMAGPVADLESFSGTGEIAREIGKLARTAERLPKALVIGAGGRSGKGAIEALKPGCSGITEWDIEETANLDREALARHDILVNCVLMTGPGLMLLGPDDLGKEGLAIGTIADVSCDPFSDYNPLPLYSRPTSWKRPFLEVGRNGKGEPVELTAIDNLPSLVPLEASEDFSTQLLPCLRRFDSGTEWVNARLVFEDKLRAAGLEESNDTV